MSVQSSSNDEENTSRVSRSSLSSSGYSRSSISQSTIQKKRKLERSRLETRNSLLESTLQSKEELLRNKDEHLKGLLEKLREQEQLDLLLKRKERQIDELQNKFQTFNEIQENLKRQQKKLDKLPELERELIVTKEKYQDLQQLVTNKLLLEEKVYDLEIRMQALAKERDELTKYQTENIGLKNFITNLKKNLAKLYDLKEFEDFNSALLVQKITELIEDSKRQELLLHDENVTLKSKLNNCEKEIIKSNEKEIEWQKQVDEQKKANIMLQQQLKLAQRKNRLLKIDRDNYRSLVDSYEKDLTVMNTSSVTTTTSKMIHDELMMKIAKLEDSQQKYRDLIKEYEKDLPLMASPIADTGLEEQVVLLKRKLEETRAENEEWKRKIADHGKIYRYADNPLMNAIKNETDEEKVALKKEVDKLKQKIFQIQKSSEVSSTSLSESVYIDSEKLIKENEHLKKKCDRYYEIYQLSLKEFRLIVVKVFGYQITKLNDFFRLTSCFDKPNEHHINFNFDSNGILHLLEGEYSSDVRNLLEQQLSKPQLLPIFISTLTVKLYRKQSNSGRHNSTSNMSNTRSSNSNVVIEID